MNNNTQRPVTFAQVTESELTEWRRDYFDDRQQKEIRLAQVYAEEFGHGTDGHGRLLLINRLAELLDNVSLLLDDQGQSQLKEVVGTTDGDEEVDNDPTQPLPRPAKAD